MNKNRTSGSSRRRPSLRQSNRRQGEAETGNFGGSGSPRRRDVEQET